MTFRAPPCILVINKNSSLDLQICYDRTAGVLNNQLPHIFLYHFHHIHTELYVVCCISYKHSLLYLSGTADISVSVTLLQVCLS